MSPHPKPDLHLSLIALALALYAVAVYRAAGRMTELVERVKVERNRRLEIEDQLETRERQLNGALETITEIKGGQPASE